MKRISKTLLMVMIIGLIFTISIPAVSSKQLTIGVVIPYEIGWFGAFKQGFELVAKQEGVKLVWQYHGYKPDQETTAIQNLITMAVDAINLTAATPDSAQYSCSLANDAKIPIQITESGLAPGKGKPIADIDFNWEQIYRYIIDNLRKDEEGPLSLVYISGFAGSPPVLQYIKGLTDELKKVKDVKLATDIQYGDYATAKSLGIMKTIIQSGVKFNVALGACQEITEGIIQALKEENIPRDKVVVVSVNGGPMDVENFKTGDLDYAISQSPSLHGMICAENLISYLKGRTYQKKAYSPFIWVSAKTWQEKLIPWDMDVSWLPVVKEFVKTGVYKPQLRKK
ncbi:MAG: sugar ABC transporter substrate-binding protein [Firmicutes bacterium]|nr:sugar ABC transporter substrate-binding protein [Bacillota bacterium]